MLEKKREEVRAFLRLFKATAQKNGVYFIPRQGFRESRLWLGLTIDNCRDEILGLTVEDYCEGPDPDKNMAGEVWVFGKDVGGVSIYVKLKLALVEGGTIAKCISFHPAAHPLSFPLR